MAKSTPWKDAVRKAVHEIRTVPGQRKEKKKALNIIAHRLVTEAMHGDMQAIKEIGDRLDGRATQALVNEDGEQLQIIERVIIAQTPEGKMIDITPDVVKAPGPKVLPERKIIKANGKAKANGHINGKVNGKANGKTNGKGH